MTVWARLVNLKINTLRCPVNSLFMVVEDINGSSRSHEPNKPAHVSCQRAELTQVQPWQEGNRTRINARTFLKKTCIRVRDALRVTLTKVCRRQRWRSRWPLCRTCGNTAPRTWNTHTGPHHLVSASILILCFIYLFIVCLLVQENI